MDEITFEDILVHYEVKLREASEEIENIKNIMKNCMNILDSAWKGSASDVFRVKMEEINNSFMKSHSELSEALTKLTAVSELLVEGEV